MTVFLDFEKAVRKNLLCDREFTIEKYTNPMSNKSFKLLYGMPLLVNVEGSYVKANDIMELVVNKKMLPSVSKWVCELKNPTGVGEPVVFKWNRRTSR